MLVNKKPSSPSAFHTCFNFFNLTGEPTFNPYTDAIALLSKALSEGSNFLDYIFNETEHMWGNYIFGPNNSTSYDKCEDFLDSITEAILLQQIPIFLVSRDISGKKVYNPVLNKNISVPQDLLPNLPVSDDLTKDDINDEVCRLYDTNDCRYMHENNPEAYLDCPLRKQCRCPFDNIGMIDVWGIFTELDAPLTTPHHHHRPFIHGRFTGTPAIFLWVDKMWESAANEKEYNWLFVKVLLHEFAHALMHIGEWGHGSFYKWREESLANAYALAKIKELGDADFYSFAESVVRKQPDNYALGAEYADKCNLHDIYHYMEEWMHIKRLDVPTFVQSEWLKYAKSCVDNHSAFDNDRMEYFDELMCSDSYLYKGRLYLDEDVVWQVIHDYSTSHPYKSLSDIMSVFPEDLNSNFKMYDVWPWTCDYDTAKENFENRDSSHIFNNIHNEKLTYDERNFFYSEDKILKASDTCFVISDYWHSEDMPRFIETAERVGIKIEKVK